MNKSIISGLCIVIVALSAGLYYAIKDGYEANHQLEYCDEYTGQVQLDLKRYESLKTKASNALDDAFDHWPDLQEDEFKLVFVPSN